ncbi:MAG: ACP S-malonyltransferase [Gammaproteobacteria bacterium]|nr:ACP S-malonyltransferase [Gammaproteobacteria bacterium]
MTRTAVVFPGQGSQSIGMLATLAPHFEQIQHTFDEASSVLNYNVWDLVQNGPIETLNETEFTQVAMLVADVAVYRVLQAVKPFTPCMMAGHSLGEYAALVCAEVMSFTDAVQLVRQRGQLMQHYVPLGTGGMAALVGLDDEIVNQLCHEASDERAVVTPANYNAIGQVVVAGHTPAVDRLVVLAEAAGARFAKKIAVSVPCHCALLVDAAKVFEGALQQVALHDPRLPIISNVDATPYVSNQAIYTQLSKQLYSPVQWVKTIQLMHQENVELIIECGPGQVLAGLIKRIERSLPVVSVFDFASLEKWRMAS